MLMNRPPKIPYIAGLEVRELHGPGALAAFEFAEDQQRLAHRDPDMWSHGELPPEIEARISHLQLS
jgi:hypothetical protein